MVEETIRHSEEELLGFISSTQDEELSCARTLAIDTVDNYPGMRVWAFEDAPASSERARDRYIRNAGRADLVIWLIGSTTTTPIVEEISACMRAQGNLLAFKLPARNRDNETDTLIRRVSDYATWKTVEKVEDLPAHIKAALTDEMLRRYRDPAPANHDLFLKRKHRESVAETKRLWTTLGVPDEIAGDLAGDHSIGHKLQFPSSGTLTVTAQQGSGKTLAAQRLYQQALVDRLQDHLQPFPIFLNARNINGDLKDQIERDTREHGTVYTQRILVIIDALDETDGSVACWDDGENSETMPPAGEFASVSAGKAHTCGLKVNGAVACWGSDGSDWFTPPAGGFASVDAGWGHTCGVQRDGAVACWGDDDEGQARRRPGSSPPSAPGGTTPAGCSGTAPWPAGAMTMKARPRRRPGSSPPSAPGGTTPAGCSGTAPSHAGAAKPAG